MPGLSFLPRKRNKAYYDRDVNYINGGLETMNENEQMDKDFRRIREILDQGKEKLQNRFKNPFKEEEGEEEYCYTDTALANEAINLCNKYFITHSGRPNWENIFEAKKYGLWIFKGESDSFGWLTAICNVKGDENKQVVFG